MEIMHDQTDNKWKRCGRDVGVLSFILILFNFSSRYLGYVFYYISYWVLTGTFTGSWEEVRSYFADRPEINDSTTFVMLANISITVACVLIALLIAGVFFKMTVWSYMMPTKQGTLTALKWTPPSFVFNMISSTIIAFFTSFLSSMGVDVPTADFSIHQPSVIAVVMQFSYVIVLAPLCEEIIYRGLIIKTIAPYSKSAAVLVSALAFGLMHGNIPQAASAFCTGLIYAVIALKCGSIIPTVIIHGLNNLIVNSPELAGALGIPYNRTVLSIIEICVALFGFFVWFTDFKFLKFETSSDGEDKKLSFSKVLTNPMLIVYFSILVIVIIVRIVQANS